MSDRNAQIEREYRSGDTAAVIGARYGITYQRVYMILRERNVPKDARPSLKEQLRICRESRLRDGNRLTAQIVAAERERDVYRAKAEEYVRATATRSLGEPSVLEFQFRIDSRIAEDKPSLDAAILTMFQALNSEFRRACGFSRGEHPRHATL